MYTMAWHQAIALPTIMVEKDLLQIFITVFQDTGFTLLNTSEQMASDYFLENASFLKMDNLTLGYSFQNLFAAKLSGRISASVQNVFTISKYSGLDPECGAIDSNIWPRPRTYTIGLNLNF